MVPTLIRPLMPCLAAGLLGWVSVGMLAAQAPARSLRDQADELALYAEGVVKQNLPRWNPTHRERWAQAFRNGVLGSRRQAVSEAEYHRLKQVIDEAARTNYPVLADESIDFQVPLMEWVVADLLSTPWPSPENTAALKAQVHDWEVQSEQQILTAGAAMLSELLGVAVAQVQPEIADAIREGCQEERERLYSKLEEPYYRYERVPLTGEEMAAAEQTIRETAEALVTRLADDIKRTGRSPTGGQLSPEEWPPERKELALARARSKLGTYAGQCLASAKARHWTMHRPPEPVRELGRRSAEPLRVVMDAYGPLVRVQRTMMLLGGLIPESTGALPGVAW